MTQLAPDVIEKMAETVRTCLEEGRPFSAYNITIMTRDRCKLRLRHKEVQESILQNGQLLQDSIPMLQDALDYGYTMADNQTYSWTRSDFSANGNSFQVYHPVSYDIKNFVPEGVQPVTQNVIASSARPANMIGQVSIQADGTQPDAGGVQPDGTFKVDFRSRLLVPTRFLKEAGINPGDEVFVVPDANTNTVILAKNTEFLQSGSISFTTQRVERNGDIRLSSRTLKAADLEDSAYIIETGERDEVGDPLKKVKVVEIKVAE